MPAFRTVKGALRAIATKVRLSQTLRRLRGKPIDHLKRSALEDRFAHIYETRLWALGNLELPGSGAGSTMDSTARMRGELPELLKTIGTRTLLDLGCGDYHWMRTMGLDGIDYVGVDIVQAVVDENNRKYGKEGVRFLQANAVSDALPGADTVLIRDVVFHLSFADSFAVLSNVLSTRRRYLLITTDGIAYNLDIVSGDWRMLNLEAAPFRFPEPEFAINESQNLPGRRLAAWKADDLRPLVHRHLT